VARFVPDLGAGVVVSEPVAQHWLDVLLHLVPNLRVGLALTQILRLLLNLLHLALNVVFLPVVAHYAFERVRVLDPLDQARVSTQGHDSVRPQLQVPLSGLGVIHQHLVTQACKVYKSLLFAQIAIFVAFEQEVVNSLVCAQNADFLRLFL